MAEIEADFRVAHVAAPASKAWTISFERPAKRQSVENETTGNLACCGHGRGQVATVVLPRRVEIIEALVISR